MSHTVMLYTAGINEWEKWVEGVVGVESRGRELEKQEGGVRMLQAIQCSKN